MNASIPVCLTASEVATLLDVIKDWECIDVPRSQTASPHFIARCNEVELVRGKLCVAKDTFEKFQQQQAKENESCRDSSKATG